MSSRSTSPDPITLPAPWSAKSTRLSSAKPAQTRANKTFASPSKSFIMQTGNASDGSPLRIRVTVEAESQGSSSPAKRRTRTTKVALKGGSSSPARRLRSTERAGAFDGAQDDDEPKSRPQKKRKGTPTRRVTQIRRDSGNGNNEDEDGAPVWAETPLQDFSIGPTKERSHLRAEFVPTERSRRLGRARKELDSAIGDAIGDSDDHLVSDQPGEMTVANEDFTMVSIATLQSLKQNQSTLESSRVGFDEASAANMSYLPSSPPQQKLPKQPTTRGDIRYPDLPLDTQDSQHVVPENNDYDAMSWKPTGVATAVLTNDKDEVIKQYEEPSEWQREREAVSKEIENASKSQVIIIDDETNPIAQEGGEDDIWAEEASRSLEEERETNPKHVRSNGESSAASLEKSTAEKIQDLFSHQPMKPPRSKIPRTWRRSSGVEISYVDSPEQGALRSRKASSGSNEAEGTRSRSSGVLTPPSTDDDVVVAALPQDQIDHWMVSPGNGAVNDDRNKAKDTGNGSSAILHEDDASPGELSSPGTDNEDTGLFWQNNLPNVYQNPRPRPRRQYAADLGDVLVTKRQGGPLQGSAVAAKVDHRSSARDFAKLSTSTNAARQQTTSEPPDDTAVAHNSNHEKKEKTIQSPLRQSLLRSSKIGGSLLSGTPAHFSAPKYHPYARPDVEESFSSTKQTSSLMDDSFESKASDQRQLLEEMTRERKTVGSSTHDNINHLQSAGVYENTSTAEVESDEDADSEEYLEEDEDHNEEDRGNEPMHSYEEHLNLDSPQKIRVKFNDSEGNSSLLAPSKSYAPLFARSTVMPTTAEHEKSVSLTLVKERSPKEAAQPGILSRLSSTFWSAVVRPSGPSAIMPETWSPENEPDYSPSLRAHIRSRYGVVANTHRWTMAHMRTLHRMHNSCTSNRSDSIIPKTGPLPPYLGSLIGTQHTAVSEFTWKFTSQHAHVVHAFMQVLVPQHFITAMESGEVDFLGDREARRHRGLILGCHGKDPVFYDDDDVLIRPKNGTPITMTFVARALGNVVLANILTDERNAREGK